MGSARGGDARKRGAEHEFSRVALTEATVFGTLGSLASRTEDASSVSGPVTIVLVLAFMASFAATGSPGTAWARLVSLFPFYGPRSGSRERLPAT